MDGSKTRFFQLLEVLVRHEVEFLIVGGVAAILEGAPILTLDLNILHRSTDDNIERLLRALEEVHAHYRDPADRLILPDATRLRTNRFNLLLTDLGLLDVVGNLGEGFAYENLVQRTHAFELAKLRVRAVDLPTMIELKELANREKDRAALPILRRTLELKSGEQGLSGKEGDEEPGT